MGDGAGVKVGNGCAASADAGSVAMEGLAGWAEHANEANSKPASKKMKKRFTKLISPIYRHR
jgi:hypothetical protein